MKPLKNIDTGKTIKNNQNTRFKKRPQYDLLEIDATDELDFFLKHEKKQKQINKDFFKMQDDLDKEIKRRDKFIVQAKYSVQQRKNEFIRNCINCGTICDIVINLKECYERGCKLWTSRLY
jgi:hypothetical protein